MKYSTFNEKTAVDLSSKGYSSYIGNGLMLSISTDDFGSDYSLVIENNENVSTLDCGEKDFIVQSFYVAICMAEKGQKFSSIENLFNSSNTKENFKKHIRGKLKKEELSSIDLEMLSASRVSYYREHIERHKQYYQENREKLLEYGKKYRNRKKRLLAA